jgi:hypothetical protein
MTAASPDSGRIIRAVEASAADGVRPDEPRWPGMAIAAA